jgi:hypothetical protein
VDPAERIVLRGIEDELGRPLSRHARQYQRSLESHLRANARPRWMERLIEIERGTEQARRRLEQAWGELRAEYAGDRRGFARAWRARAQAWDFEELNELIRTHNEWYPVERDLPVDPRTGKFRRSHRRDELNARWILARFPADG